jgi:hypothetical protein
LSPRLLLNSRSPRCPNGLANSSSLVGCYLTGHVTASILGYLEEWVGTPPVNNGGANDHSYIPRFNVDGRKQDYVDGYGYQMMGRKFCARPGIGSSSTVTRSLQALPATKREPGAWGVILALPCSIPIAGHTT